MEVSAMVQHFREPEFVLDRACRSMPVGLALGGVGKAAVADTFANLLRGSFDTLERPKSAVAGHFRQLAGDLDRAERRVAMGLALGGGRGGGCLGREARAGAGLPGLSGGDPRGGRGLACMLWRVDGGTFRARDRGPFLRL